MQRHPLWMHITRRRTWDKLRELDGLRTQAEPGTPGDFPGRAGGRGWAEEGQLGCLAQPIPMATRPE